MFTYIHIFIFLLRVNIYIYWQIADCIWIYIYIYTHISIYIQIYSPIYMLFNHLYLHLRCWIFMIHSIHWNICTRITYTYITNSGGTSWWCWCLGQARNKICWDWSWGDPVLYIYIDIYIYRQLYISINNMVSSLRYINIIWVSE